MKTVNTIVKILAALAAVTGIVYVVATYGDQIVACGGVAPYESRLDECFLLTIFVLPEYQGRGIGRKIIETLEADEYALRSKRIDLPASITGRDFYLKFGYAYKGGIKDLYPDRCYRLEKFL